MAPSPTGADVHVGSIATALMNFAWAKKNKGQFVIRVEDTDRARLVSGGEEKMLKTFENIGLVADESPIVGGPHTPYRQSERLGIYKKYAEELVKKGKAYYCICSPERLAKMREEQQKNKQIPKYDRLCLNNQEEVKTKIKEEKIPYVIRLRIPDEIIEFSDLIRGKITVSGKDIDDQVILKSDGYPTYHLGVVVDDHLMEITHVIRGEEWLPSTPKHVILYRSFGWHLPVFVHVSLLRNPDKSKLSKRKNPVWTSWYLDQGIYPQALLNYLSLMGWSHPEGREIFSLDEYVKVFDIKDIQKTAPVFDPIKLEWMNGMYIRESQNSKLKTQILDFYKNKSIMLNEQVVEKTIPLIKERIKKLSDYLPLCDFLFNWPQYTGAVYRGQDKQIITAIIKSMERIQPWEADIIGKKMEETAKKLGIKNSHFFMVLRVVMSGKKITPPLNESMEILGKEECLKRISNFK